MFIRSALFVILTALAAENALVAQPNGYPTNDPSQALYQGLNAKLLAEQVKSVYNGEHWDDSLLIEFDHVLYTKNNKEIARYHHKWNRLTDEAILSGKLDDGRPFEVRFSNLSERKGTMLVDSVPIREEFLSTSLETAYEQFMGEVRWLFLPVQLLDSGVTVKRLADTSIADKDLSTLAVTIEPDSASRTVTSFVLFINPTYHNIERWSVTVNGRTRDYIWRLYRRVGPFLFSTKRWADDLETYVLLDNISITELTPETIAELKKKPFNGW